MWRILCIGLLFIGTISDIKTKTIPVWLVPVGIIAGVINVIFSENKSELIMGGVFGLVVFSMSVFVNEFGTGDGLMIIIIGLMRGLSICMEGLLIAFLLVIVSGGVAMLIKRISGRRFIPFFPYLLIGTIAVEMADMFTTA